MRTRAILAFIAVFLAGVVVGLAEDQFMGTWKLNEKQSTFPPGATKNHTVVYAPAGDNIKVTVDGTDKNGKAIHNEWTGKFDGKDYPVTGDPTSDMRSYKQLDSTHLALTVKKQGQVTSSGSIVVTSDGKSRTVRTRSNVDGKMQEINAVYDKQ